MKKKTSKKQAKKIMKKTVKNHPKKVKKAVKKQQKRAPEKKIKVKISREELIKYKSILLDKKGSLLKDINHISKDTLNKSQRDVTGELSGYTFHMADVATDNYDRDFGLGLATAEQKVVWEIDEALGRINDKTFGSCQSCGNKIGKERLLAIPYTKFCKECQQAEERKK